MSELGDVLAEYVSHKRVRAGEIVDVREPRDGFAFITITKADGLLYGFSINEELYYRGGHTPGLGDRLVVYGDGTDEYLSISPKKAFEEGYGLVENIEAPNEAPDEPHDIGWAMRQLLAGGKVARQDWPAGSYLVLFVGAGTQVLTERVPANAITDDLALDPVDSDFCFAITDLKGANLFATDWVTVP